MKNRLIQTLIILAILVLLVVQDEQGWFMLIREQHETREDNGFENIENFRTLSTEQQEQIRNLIGEWELAEWSVQWRGYDYNQDWRQEDDFYIGRKVTIQADGTATYMEKEYQVEQDAITTYGMDIALGSGYIAGDAERLGEQMVLGFSPSETDSATFWIHIGEDGQVYYRDEMTGGLYSMKKIQIQP